MKLDNTLVVFKINNTKHLSVIQRDQIFVTQNGTIAHNDIDSLPSVVKTSQDYEYEVLLELKLYRPYDHIFFQKQVDLQNEHLMHQHQYMLS